MASKGSFEKFRACTPKRLGEQQKFVASQLARRINPANAPQLHRAFRNVSYAPEITPAMIAASTTQWWGPEGVNLGVYFLDKTGESFRKKVLEKANAWGAQGANIKFFYSEDQRDVRISLGPGGYWSYLGTDILAIDKREPTMNLEGFSTKIPESEWNRVVKHEFGHTCGFPHEHMRPEIIALIDRNKAIKYFKATQGWSQQEVIEQVLSPLDPHELVDPTQADQTSCMCYELPGSITKSGKPIIGGEDINQIDYDYVNRLYPGTVTPIPVDPGPLDPPVISPPVGIADITGILSIKGLGGFKITGTKSL
jgi:hypothetical protein